MVIIWTGVRWNLNVFDLHFLYGQGSKNRRAQQVLPGGGGRVVGISEREQRWGKGMEG
jgi:hypothetical protein